MSYTPGLIVIPHRILYMEGMQLSYIKVYEHIFHLWHQDLPCFISNPEFSKRTGLAESTVKEAIAFLIGKGELSRSFKGRKRYLKQPERKIEYIEYQDDEKNDIPPVDNSDNNCIKNNHPADLADGSQPTWQTAASRDSRPYKEYKDTKLNNSNLNKTNKRAFNNRNGKKVYNLKRHDFAESMNAMANEAMHIKQNEEYKRSPMPDYLKKLCKKVGKGSKT